MKIQGRKRSVAFTQPKPKTVVKQKGDIVHLRNASDSQSDLELSIEGSDDERERNLAFQNKHLSSFKEDGPSKARETDPEVDQLTVSDCNSIEECTPELETDKKLKESIGATALVHPSQEPQQPDFTFPKPLSERLINPDYVTEEEQKVHLNFFNGRGIKNNPARYKVIRNSIISLSNSVKPGNGSDTRRKG